MSPLGNAAMWGGDVRVGAGGQRRLILGHLDGSHRLLLDLGDSPRSDGVSIISGPARGMVLVAVQRDSAWGLQIVTLKTGQVRQLVEIDANLWDAALSPRAEAAYWLVGSEGPDGGVWRMDLATGAIDRVLAPDPVARANGTVLAAAQVPLGQLAVSDDGRLAVLECYHACRLRLVELATGTFVDYDPPASTGQDLVGFVPAGIDFWGGCILLPRGDVIERDCPDPDGAVAALEAQRAMAFSVELPVGWMLELQPLPDAPMMSFDMMVLAVSAESGDRVRLRAIGTVHGQ